MTSAKLLQKINERLPPADQERYDALALKLPEETLDREEQKELLELVDRIEHADAERVRALSRLAQLRGVSVEALMADLGISPPA